MAEGAQSLLRRMVEPQVVHAICARSHDRERVEESVKVLFDYIDALAMPAPASAPSPSGHPDADAFAMFCAFVRANAPALRLVAHWGDGRCGALHEVLVEQLLGNGSTTAPKSGGTVS